MFLPVIALGVITQRFLFWLGAGLSMLVLGQFLIHPPTGWMIWNVTVPSVLLVGSVVTAVRPGRDAWCLPVVIVALSWMVRSVGQASSTANHLPSDIDVNSVVSLGTKDIFSGCGAAVFGLAPWTAKALLMAGPAGLRSRSGSDPRYGAWTPTPIVPSKDRVWPIGLGCGLDHSWKGEIEDAMDRSGGYLAEQRRQAVLVFPEQRIAVIVYRGP